MRKLFCGVLLLGVVFIGPTQKAPAGNESKGGDPICGLGCSCTCLFLCGGFEFRSFDWEICYTACLGGCWLGGGGH